MSSAYFITVHVEDVGIRPKILPHSKGNRLLTRSNPLIFPHIPGTRVGGAKL